MRRTNCLLLLMAGLVFLVFVPRGASAVTAERFVQRLKLKFKKTSHIYLRARSTRVTDTKSQRSDTSDLVVAYEYPDHFLQSLNGAGNRRQHFIVRGDSMVLSYPHLDQTHRRSVTDRELQAMVLRHVPMAAALMGMSQGKVPLENIDVAAENGVLRVRVTNRDERFPFREAVGRFTRKNLKPLSFILRGRHDYRVEILEYVEEERFPEYIERAFASLDPGWLEEHPG